MCSAIHSEPFNLKRSYVLWIQRYQEQLTLYWCRDLNSTYCPGEIGFWIYDTLNEFNTIQCTEPSGMCRITGPYRAPRPVFKGEFGLQATREAMYVHRTTEARSCSHCCSGQAISITYFDCVFATLVIQHAKRMRRIVICVLSGFKIFSLVIS